jgi:hypothetical protein
MSRKKPAPGSIGGEHRFSDQEMRQRKEAPQRRLEAREYVALKHENHWSFLLCMVTAMPSGRHNLALLALQNGAVQPGINRDLLKSRCRNIEPL